jgi:L-fucose isomerase-like protein
MEEYDAEGITVNGCMNLGKSAQTTPCLAFSFINDEGLMAFCESDFNVIPSGILLRHIAGKPVFLNDPTFPHNGVTTCAHCHSPRRMNGKDLEPTHIYTHCESDYGAAPKVEFRKGQVITNIIPDFNQDKWVGFSGTIIDHPFYAICRSQFDCTINGNWEKLLQNMGGFHWMTCYGDYLQEINYVAKKVGIQFENISSLTY